MRIDWENNLIFKDGVYELDKLPVDYTIEGELEFPKGVEWHGKKKVLFCF